MHYFLPHPPEHAPENVHKNALSSITHAIQGQFVWPWNVTFALLRPRPALELCGGGFMTTDSLLWVTGGCVWWVMSVEVGAVFKDESKNGFLLERPGPASLPSIRVIVLPWVILPPSGHCPLLRARIMFLLDNPLICWLRRSASPFRPPLIIVPILLPAVLLWWLAAAREMFWLSGANPLGDFERGSSLKGSVSGVGK